ncbi:MAG: hypothetical protein H8D56_18895 [Planctomycetes bacterium]|nr:hypothetical protein [Planctomycetota bacterium]MBL7145234.1 hypothetical protein [Phycisphaerae bacterium]
MSVLHEDKERKIIPRWRGFYTTLEIGELYPIHVLKKRRPIPNDILAIKRKEWEENHSISFAADLMSTGVAFGEEDCVKDAAEFILSNNMRLSETTKAIANHVLKVKPKEKLGDNEIESDEFSVRRQIHDLRLQLYDEPRNSFLWTNIALLYASLGFAEQSTHAIEVALSLAPQNRFVLRSSARLFVHIDDYKRAHNILRYSDNVKHDPWLLAAEIAVAGTAHRTSRFIKNAINILEFMNFSPFHVSELASALSTLDFEAGNLKHGRKHLKMSLKQPTENSVAQAAWLERKFFGVRVEQFEKQRPMSHEALAWDFCRKTKWNDTVVESLKWLNDQPFSSRPAILGSYISAVSLGEYEKSANIAHRGLIANPKDFTLLNNLAFALGHIGRLKDAREVFGRIRESTLSTEEKFVSLATKGFLCYREGNVAGGRKLYLEALEKGRKGVDEKRRASAFLWMTMEELRIGSEESCKYKREVLDFAKILPYPDLRPLINRVEKHKGS